MAKFKDMAEVRRVNKAQGMHWFDRDTMSFFKSRIESALMRGHYFVTSEQTPHGPRRYSLRYVRPSGAIETVGDFMAYYTKDEAKEHIADDLPKWDADLERTMYLRLERMRERGEV